LSGTAAPTLSGLYTGPAKFNEHHDLFIG
jgi:hypothetical protein